MFIYTLNRNIPNIVGFIFPTEGENVLETFYFSVQNSSPLHQPSLTFQNFMFCHQLPLQPKHTPTHIYTATHRHNAKLFKTNI